MLVVLGDVVGVVSLWLATLLLGALTREHRLLEAERARSERLLRNMLPTSIAERLKQQQEIIADGFPEVSVLFADIVGFTPHVERAPPQATVALLNELFSRFDALADAGGLRRSRPSGMPTWWPAGCPI